MAAEVCQVWLIGWVYGRLPYIFTVVSVRRHMIIAGNHTCTLKCAAIGIHDNTWLHECVLCGLLLSVKRAADTWPLIIKVPVSLIDSLVSGQRYFSKFGAQNNKQGMNIYAVRSPLSRSSTINLLLQEHMMWQFFCCSLASMHSRQHVILPS